MVRAWLVVVLILAAVPVLRADDAGWHRGVRPKAKIERLVSLSPSTTETMFALGLGPRVVGVTRYCDRPPEVGALPRVGGFSDPSLEAILALKPHAVVAVPSEGNRRVVDRLVDLGVPVLVVPDTTLQDVEVAVDTLGRELGAVDAARALRASMKARLEAVSARVGNRPPVRVLVVYDHRPWIVAGPGAFADGLVRRAGGINVVKEAATAYPTLSLETVLRLQPDVIIDASMAPRAAGSPSVLINVLAPYATTLPAARHGRILALASGTLARPGPSVAADVELLSELLHPSSSSTDGGR